MIFFVHGKFIYGMKGNSHGGKSINTTQYQMFWDACKEVLLLVCPSHDHKNSADIYASTTHSITNLITQATYILQDKIDSKEINEMPLISGIE